MATLVQTTLPEEQKEIIIQALNNLEAQMAIFRKLNTEGTEDTFLSHDILTLKSLLKYKVTVELTDTEHKRFTFDNGVDFPEWS